MQFPFQGKPPLGIVYNTSMSRPDAALALTLIHGFEGKREARLSSIAVTGAGLVAASFCDVVGRIYTGSGFFVNSNRVLPVGLNADGPLAPDSPAVRAALDRRNEKGEPAYAREVTHVSDTAEIPALIRNSLTNVTDGNGAVILSAPAKDLAHVLELYGTSDLIVAKVRVLIVVDAGAVPDVAAMRKLLAEWPTPVVLCGRETGDAIRYPASSIEKDFAWTPAHPVVDFYRAYRQMPYDAPAWDLVAALYAARPDSKLFHLSDPGRIQLSDSGDLKFDPAPDGKARRLLPDPAQTGQIVQTIVEIASAKPVPRVPFRRLQQKAEEKK